MRLLAHLSDLHFGRLDRAVVAALEADLATRAPDLVIVSGDLTQRGRHHEFLEARAFLDRVARPALVVPGNHDVPAFNLASRFLRPYRRFTRHISDELFPLVVDGDVAVLGLNTARRAVRHWNWAFGSLNRTQLERAAQTLAGAVRAESGLRLVVTHHPLVSPPGHMGRPTLFHAERALGAFARAHVDVLLSGHLHRTHAALAVVPDPTPGAPARPMVLIQAGSATSTRLRGEGNGYNLVRLETHPPGLAVETRAWTGTEFETAAMQAFSRADGRWAEVTTALPR